MLLFQDLNVPHSSEPHNELSTKSTKMKKERRSVSPFQLNLNFRTLNEVRLPSHRSFRSGRNQLSVLCHDTGLVAWRARFPLFEPRLQFFLGNRDIQPTRFDIEHDRVAIMQRGDR